MFEKKSSDPGVDRTVADDEDMEQRLPDTTTILHLPARDMVLPHMERIVAGLAPLINVDLVLGVVPIFPPEKLCPCDQLPLPLVVHEPRQLGLDHGLHGLGAPLGKGLHQQSSLLEVGQLVQRAIILSAGSGDDSVKDNSRIEDCLLVATI